MRQCLTHLVAFWGWVALLVDKERPTDVVYPDLCKVLDAITHDVLVSLGETWM